MTPKEEAKAIISKFQAKEIIEYTEHAGLKPTYSKLNDREAKECALIAVKELIESFSRYTGMYDQEFFTSEADYWKEVKEEINKL